MVLSKYGAVATTVDNVRFASKAEARRYQELKILLRAGEIRDLELQPKFPIAVNGVKIGSYFADFRYRSKAGVETVEDVKGGAATATPLYRWKKKLVLALYGVEIVEVQ